jgi:deoxyribose-phosphate aldolase
VRTRDDAEKMVAAGATRLGASAGVKIVRGGDAAEASTAGKGKY